MYQGGVLSSPCGLNLTADPTEDSLVKFKAFLQFSLWLFHNEVLADLCHSGETCETPLCFSSPLSEDPLHNFKQSWIYTLEVHHEYIYSLKCPWTAYLEHTVAPKGILIHFWTLTSCLKKLPCIKLIKYQTIWNLQKGKKMTHFSEPFLQLLLISRSQGPISVDVWSQFLSSSHRCPSRITAGVVHHINFEHVPLTSDNHKVSSFGMIYWRLTNFFLWNIFFENLAFTYITCLWYVYLMNATWLNNC